MPLAQSQWHQLFPGFLRPGFFCFLKRCQGQFQGVCGDLNLSFPRFSPGSPTSALLRAQKIKEHTIFESYFFTKFWAPIDWSCRAIGSAPFFILRKESEAWHYGGNQIQKGR
jgi:hypothetical protein